jgi:hypothetical protein
MKVERSFLVRVVQVYEGDPPADWNIEQVTQWMNWNHDQYVCDNWKLVSDKTQSLDDDQLSYEVVQ